MTFISPRSLTNSIAPFSPYAGDLKTSFKSFGAAAPGYNVSDSYLPHRPASYGLPFDYHTYRNEPSFYIPTQSSSGGIYSGINPMEPMNSFDLYSSSVSANQNAVTSSMSQVAGISNGSSQNSLLPSIQMPKLQAVGLESQSTSAERPSVAQRVESLAQGSIGVQNPQSIQQRTSPVYPGAPSAAADMPPGATSSTSFASHFLSHQSPVSSHGFFGASQAAADNLAASFATASHNPSWSLVDHHIVTY